MANLSRLQGFIWRGERRLACGNERFCTFHTAPVDGSGVAEAPDLQVVDSVFSSAQLPEILGAYSLTLLRGVAHRVGEHRIGRHEGHGLPCGPQRRRVDLPAFRVVLVLRTRRAFAGTAGAGFSLYRTTQTRTTTTRAPKNTSSILPFTIWAAFIHGCHHRKR